MTTSKYRPIMKPEMHRPLAPSVTCGASSLPEGAFFAPLLGKGKTNVSPINTGIIHTISKKSGEIPTYLSYLLEGL